MAEVYTNTEGQTAPGVFHLMALGRTRVFIYDLRPHGLFMDRRGYCERRGPVLHFGALRLVALRKEGRAEEILAAENEREEPMRAPEQVNSANAALRCWSAACSPLPARSANWLDGPCLASCSMYLEGSF